MERQSDDRHLGIVQYHKHHSCVAIFVEVSVLVFKHPFVYGKIRREIFVHNKRKRYVVVRQRMRKHGKLVAALWTFDLKIACRHSREIEFLQEVDDVGDVFKHAIVV